jgi:hypothetical protein
LLARRWLLYVLTCAAVFALQAIFYVSVRDKKLADLCAGLVGTPLVIVVVTVFTGSDATNTLTTAERWERILERAWALIVLDVGLSFVQISGLQTMLLGASDAGDTILGFLTLLLSAMLVYAEPFAALQKDVQTITLLPFALLRSMMLGWVNISRIFSLFAVQIAAMMAALLLDQAVAKAGADAAALISLAFGTVLSAPLAALFTVAYLDTLSQEQLTIK